MFSPVAADDCLPTPEPRLFWANMADHLLYNNLNTDHEPTVLLLT